MRIKIRILSILTLCAGIASMFSSCVSTQTEVSNVKAYRRLGKQVAVAVLDVTNKTKYGARSLADAAAEILTSELIRSGNFIVIERRLLDDILKEMEIQLSDLSDNKTAAKVGELLNCTYLLTGTISNFGVKTEGQDLIIAQKKVQTVKVEVDIRMIKVETAQIVYSAYGSGVATKTISSGLGVGGSGGYDESLGGECMRSALGDAVEGLTNYLADNPQN